ncbi:MAG: type I DNA topoisomerase, partial [Candidatus Roizmanbacteria bacterium]|nr:type I DNA topoisomerase [Candidatus Roizmanbacteria bacterium]
AKEHDEIILATDLDREGESISYHVAFILGLIKENWPNIEFADVSKKVKRIVFHEITAAALKEALENPAELRIDLVKAQQARRILDRIVGYELSPLLWKKTGKNWLSAGRVQTVGVRLVVEREKERTAFGQEGYILMTGTFTIEGNEVTAKLKKIKGEVVEISKTIKLYAGEYTFTRTSITNETAEDTKKVLMASTYEVANMKEAVTNRYPTPPYTTSSLQQDAFFKCGFSSRQVMSLAQSLYEKGFITYHRTDSFNLSTQFVFRAKDYIIEKFGKEYALEKPRGYRTKSRSAQEAHEAIRPTKLIEVDDLGKKKESLTVNHKKLYKLIFDRAVATQMKEAELKTVTFDLVSPEAHMFEASATKVVFDGFLKLMESTKQENRELAKVTDGTKADIKDIEVKDQKTSPPPRYNEASLIRTMEEEGIGRPSTYAAIISLIQVKGYVEKDGRYFIPTVIGTAISDYLSKSFSKIFELDFTSDMENKFDEIAEGKQDVVTVLDEFYKPFTGELDTQKKEVGMIAIKEETNEVCPKCGKPMIIRFSKFGKFYACSGYPNCKTTKPFLFVVKNRKCPKCTGDIVVKFTKSRKKFYGCSNYPTCDFSSWALNKIPAPVTPDEKKPSA